jgi:hypothetical protein
LAATYKTNDEASLHCQRPSGFYETKYPDVAKTKQPEIHNAVASSADLQPHYFSGHEAELADTS